MRSRILIPLWGKNYISCKNLLCSSEAWRYVTNGSTIYWKSECESHSDSQKCRSNFKHLEAKYGYGPVNILSRVNFVVRLSRCWRQVAELHFVVQYCSVLIQATLAWAAFGSNVLISVGLGCCVTDLNKVGVDGGFAKNGLTSSCFDVGLQPFQF